MPLSVQVLRRKFFSFTALLLVSALLAACPGRSAPPAATPQTGAASAQTPAQTATASAASTQQGTLRISVVCGAMIDTMRKLATQYMQSHPNVKVNVEEEPEGGAFDALIAAGNQPDMIVGSLGSQIGHLAAGGAVVPLEGLPGAADLFARLDKATVEQLYGHNYYVPVSADVTMMIYNKEIFKQAGLDPNKPPATWDEFLADAAKIDKLPALPNGDKIRGTVFWNEALTFGGWYWNVLQPIYLNGNQNQCLLLNRLGTDIVFDQPQCNMAGFFDFAQKAQKFAPPTMEKSFFSRSIGIWLQYGYSWEPNLKTAANKPMVIGQDVAIAPAPIP
ncbi:MAG: extracellular solute-binding protein [Caldilineaceae bacterium]